MKKRQPMLLYYIALLATFPDLLATQRSIQDCKSFLDTEPAAVHAEFSDKIKTVTFDDDYQLHHEIAYELLGVTAEDKDTISLCVGISEIESYTKHKVDSEGKDSITWAWAEGFPSIPAAIVNVSTECWTHNSPDVSNCEPVFIPMPDFMKSALLSYSPVNVNFWNLLDSESFMDRWAKELVIQNNNHTVPSEWVPKLRLSKLQVLHLKGNNWGRPVKLLSHLPTLRRLDLTYNNIQELPADTFENTPMVVDILLARNNLSVFPSGLDKLARLSLLDITNPEGRAKLTISDGDITTLRRVQTMGLENINLSANIAELLNLPSMRFLNLSGCGIETIDEISTERQTKPLTLLDLSKNKLKELPPKLFSTLKNIRTLLLQENLFETCSEFIIDNLVELTHLDLSHNSISYLKTMCFQKSHYSLTYLDLSYNQLSHIPRGIFKKIYFLEILKLTNNKLTSVEPYFFEGISHLKMLDLSSNQISSEIYFETIDIDTLILSNNHIISLENTSNPDKKFSLLDVSRNNLSHWAMDFPSAIMLNLSYNTFTNLSEETRVSLDKHIKMVDLGGNAFSCCDDEIENVKDWLKNTHVDVQNLETKHALKCYVPGENQQYPMKSFLDEEGLCRSISLPNRSLPTKTNSVLYGVIGVLATLVCFLAVVVGYLVYKQRDSVLKWFRFTDA